MSVQLALISFSCVTVIGCTANAEIKPQQKFIDIQPSKNLKLTTEQSGDEDVLIISDSSAENSAPSLMESSSRKTWNIDNHESNQDNFPSQELLTAPVWSGSYMTLTSMRQTNALGNPLYELRLYANGQSMGTFMTVAGRADTQNKNRHRSGTEAPLPDGRYRVARVPTHGTIPEAGDRFLPIQPLFQTDRTALGIHLDPSFEKNNGEDGTSGCIGLTNRRDLDRVLEYVRTHRPQYIEVNIQ